MLCAQDLILEGFEYGACVMVCLTERQMTPLRGKLSDSTLNQMVQGYLKELYLKALAKPSDTPEPLD